MVVLLAGFTPDTARAEARGLCKVAPDLVTREARALGDAVQMIGEGGVDVVLLELGSYAADCTVAAVDTLTSCTARVPVVVRGSPAQRRCVAKSLRADVVSDWLQHATERQPEVTARALALAVAARERDRAMLLLSRSHPKPLSESERRWMNEISDALARNRFELMAQPIRSLATGDAPSHYELLLRLRTRDGALVSPGICLGAAERLGMVKEIDRWVVRRAIDLLAEHHRAGIAVRLGVNLSGRTLGDGGMLRVIEQWLAASDAPPDHLVFEITETAAVANITRARVFAENLSALGCRFALDDFGAGFSSFYYLKHLPADYLKLDGEYVRRCVDNVVDRTLISAAVMIGRGLGKQTIAECVEDEPTVQALLELGVDFGQGFHLGAPVPVAHVMELERARRGRAVGVSDLTPRRRQRV